MSGFLVRPGVGGRLLLAFLGITAFAGLGAAAGIYALLEIGDVLERITQQRVPSAFAAQEVSRQAERVVSAAPTLLTVTDEGQRAERSRRVDAELERLEDLIRELAEADFTYADLNPIWDISREFRFSLLALNLALNGRLVLASRKKEAVRQLLGTYDQTQQLLEPWVLVTNARIAKWRDTKSKAGPSPIERAATDSDLDESLSWLSSLQRVRLSLTSITEKLQGLAASGDADSLKLAGFRVILLLREAREGVAGLAPKLQPQMSSHLDRFAGFASGPESITRIREAEIAQIAEAERSLQQNAELAGRLTEAVDKLVARARNDMAAANREALSARRFSLSATAVAVALSLLSSALIVWLYVGRNLVARLTALSDSMLAIAGGNLKAELPTGGGDEIGRMAEALTIFRDTAVEIEDKNLREIAGARQRLVDAIESASEGFAFYDAEDRLELSNTRYRDLLYPDREAAIAPGMSFEAIVRRAIEGGLILGDHADIAALVQERMERHRNPGEPFLQQRSDGRWVQISERRTEGGGTVAVYSDLTKLKQAEEALREAKERAEHALSDLKEAQANLIHAEKMASLGQMTAGIAHEIKNPLNFVNNFAQTSVELLSELQEIVEPGLGDLAEDGRDEAVDLFETLRSDLDTIAKHGRRADGIVKNMLLHSRGGATDHESTDVNALVEESVSLAYHGERARDSGFNIGIEHDFDPEAGVVDLLPQEITRVLVNLCGNGFYATRKRVETSENAYEPKIRVSTRSLGDGIEIRVRDNGIGMPAKVREKLFTPFFTTKPAGEGTGLGLSLSFDIVTQQHRGSIEVASEEGEYTEITIHLPRQFGGALPVGNGVSP